MEILKKHPWKIFIGIIILIITIARLTQGPVSTTHTSDNTVSTNNPNTKTLYIDGAPVEIPYSETPPPGYEKGDECSDCGGTGVITLPTNGRQSVCAACNGRGFSWRKKTSN